MDRRWYYLGIAILIAAILFHQPLLAVIGLLLLLVVGTTDIWARYCLRNLRYSRQLSEQRALFGEEVTLSLCVENAKLLPLPWLEVEDTMPRGLPIKGRRLRGSLRSDTVVLESLFSPRWYERVTRRYTIQCRTRGVHQFGPTVVRSGDVFGFLNQEESLSNWQYLLVYPLVVPLTRFGLPARHPFGDRRAPRRLLEDPSRIIGVRDYAYGDSLRRVHWKATARTMQLQSKVYEATTTYTLVLFLNVAARVDGYYGINPDLQELAICAAASVTDWAIDEGYEVGFYANTIMYMPETEEESATTRRVVEDPEHGLEDEVAAQLRKRRIHLPAASSDEQRKRIMEVLARVQPFFGSAIEDVIQAERTRLPAGATVVVITSAVNDPLLETLARLRQAGHAVTLLFVGDAPMPSRLGGITVHHIGGEETWKELVAAYGGGEHAISTRATQEIQGLEQNREQIGGTAGFSL